MWEVFLKDPVVLISAGGLALVILLMVFYGVYFLYNITHKL